jgi:hypothetical protein
MALTVHAKTLLLLVAGAAITVFLLLPLRFTPVTPQSIDTLDVQARGQLIQRYEAPARHLRAQADSLRARITAWRGGTTPSQDSLLGVLESGSKHMLSVIGHLRDPRQATFEERRNDIVELLEQDLADARTAADELRAVTR